MDIEPFVVGFVMLGSAAIGATRKILERRRARRALLAAKTRDDEGEVVRVTGVVRAVAPLLVAPLSATECVLYRSRVVPAGTFVRRAFAPNESFEIVAFAVERDDGSVVEIEGTHALLDLPNVELAAPDQQQRKDAFLAVHKITAHDGVFEEVVVAPGTRIEISGLAMKDVGVPDGEAGYRDEAPMMLRLAGDATHPLVIGACYAGRDEVVAVLPGASTTRR